jgi:hypothetical protein
MVSKIVQNILGKRDDEFDAEADDLELTGKHKMAYIHHRMLGKTTANAHRRALKVK